MSRPNHCEWCPFPDCDSCVYKGHERVVLIAAWREGCGVLLAKRASDRNRMHFDCWADHHCGLDKALRATFDALTEAGIWRDDKLVAQVTASKVYGDRPGARIHVEPIGGAS